MAAPAPLAKLAPARLETIRPHLALDPAPEDLLAASTDAAEALDRLEAGGFLLEATRLLAHALPRREAVWWACMCALHTAPPDLPEPDRAAREAAEAWVRRPVDELRRFAMAQARAAGFRTPEAWAAAAAFFAGDSLTEPEQPVVPPAPHLTGAAASGAVALAAVRTDPARAPARFARFLESGRDIAAGGGGRLAPEDG